MIQKSIQSSEAEKVKQAIQKNTSDLANQLGIADQLVNLPTYADKLTEIARRFKCARHAQGEKLSLQMAQMASKYNI